jgi:hypothetical protein
VSADRQAHELDLRQLAGWCQQHQVRLFQIRRAVIEFSPGIWKSPGNTIRSSGYTGRPGGSALIGRLCRAVTSSGCL